MRILDFSGLNLDGIEYTPETGEFFRIHRQRGVRLPITPTPTKNGYLRARIDGQHVMLHDMAFWLMMGCMPNEIDHINRIPADNRWENLRDCTRSDNCLNRVNSTGGVTYRTGGKRVRRWAANITAFCDRFHLGTFELKGAAQAAYATAKVFVKADDQSGLCEFIYNLKAQHKRDSATNYRASAHRHWEMRLNGIPK